MVRSLRASQTRKSPIPVPPIPDLACDPAILPGRVIPTPGHWQDFVSRTSSSQCPRHSAPGTARACDPAILLGRVIPTPGHWQDFVSRTSSSQCPRHSAPGTALARACDPAILPGRVLPSTAPKLGWRGSALVPTLSCPTVPWPSVHRIGPGAGWSKKSRSFKLAGWARACAPEPHLSLSLTSHSPTIHAFPPHSMLAQIITRMSTRCSRMPHN